MGRNSKPVFLLERAIIHMDTSPGRYSVAIRILDTACFSSRTGQRRAPECEALRASRGNENRHKKAPRERSADI